MKFTSKYDHITLKETPQFRIGDIVSMKNDETKKFTILAPVAEPIKGFPFIGKYYCQRFELVVTKLLNGTTIEKEELTTTKISQDVLMLSKSDLINDKSSINNQGV